MSEFKINNVEFDSINFLTIYFVGYNTDHPGYPYAPVIKSPRPRSSGFLSKLGSVHT